MKIFVDKNHLNSIEAKVNLISENYELVISDINNFNNKNISIFNNKIQESKILIDGIKEYNGGQTNLYKQLFNEIHIDLTNYENKVYQRLYEALDDLINILYNNQENLFTETYDMYYDFIIRLKIYVSTWKD